MERTMSTWYRMALGMGSQDTGIVVAAAPQNDSRTHKPPYICKQVGRSRRVPFGRRRVVVKHVHGHSRCHWKLLERQVRHRRSEQTRHARFGKWKAKPCQPQSMPQGAMGVYRTLVSAWLRRASCPPDRPWRRTHNMIRRTSVQRICPLHLAQRERSLPRLLASRTKLCSTCHCCGINVSLPRPGTATDRHAVSAGCQRVVQRLCRVLVPASGSTFLLVGVSPPLSGCSASRRCVLWDSRVAVPL